MRTKKPGWYRNKYKAVIHYFPFVLPTTKEEKKKSRLGLCGCEDFTELHGGDCAGWQIVDTDEQGAIIFSNAAERLCKACRHTLWEKSVHTEAVRCGHGRDESAVQTGRRVPRKPRLDEIENEKMDWNLANKKG